MPVRNAFASASLDYQQTVPGGPFHVTLRVWSHSYDSPDPARRNALIKEVHLTHLPGASHPISNARITDRYGIDETGLWTYNSGASEEGFTDYAEWGASTGSQWGSFTGVYDERCVADPACDARRLQTYRLSPHKIVVFNYLIGPVTFSFDITLPAPPKAVRLVMGHIGGNGGNPAQRSPALPDETFVIQFP
jgi:hypothetical protein